MKYGAFFIILFHVVVRAKGESEGSTEGFVQDGLKAVRVFQEEEPGSVFGAVELRGATGLFAEGVVDIAEGLFKSEMCTGET